MNFPSVRGGQGLSKGRQGLGERGGGGWLEAWNKGAGALGRVSKGLGAGAWTGPKGWGWGGGWTLGGRDGRSVVRLFVRLFVRSDGQTDGNSPLCSSGPLAKSKVRKGKVTQAA